MDASEIMVSINCTTYNQEKYIRKCLSSLVVQKTDFLFEIIVHDDASTDNTAAIIKEFEKKYPRIIRPIFQSENQYSKHIKISETYVIPFAKGKYIAFCEGDDYWSDPYKLQKQVDALENNKDCIACFHGVEIVDESGDKTGGAFPRYKGLMTKKLESTEFLSLVVYTQTLHLLQFQISSCLARKEVLKKYYMENPCFKQISDVGDLPMFLYLGMQGYIYYINDYMSCYRSGAKGSWNVRNADVVKKVHHLELEIATLQAFDKYSCEVVHESVEKGIENRKFAIQRVRHNIKGMKEFPHIFMMMTRKAKIKAYLYRYAPSIVSLYAKLVLRNN